MTVLLAWGAAEPDVPLHGSGGFTRNGEFPSLNAPAATTPRFGSWSGSDAHEGELRSDPFRAALAISFLVAGYPASDGIAIYLERLDDHSRHQLALSVNPGEAWTRVSALVPLSLIGRPVRLYAVDAARHFRGWLGIADVKNTMLLAAIVKLPDLSWPVTGWVLLFFTSLLALVPLAPERLARLVRFARRPALFLAVVGVTIVFFRRPTIISSVLLNMDEAQMTAQAITFIHHPIPWADFDGTTSGPLNTIVLALPRLVGFTPTLASSRGIGAALLVATLLLFYGTLRRLGDEASARIAILLPLALIAGITDAACLQYASELVPIFLSAIALWCLVRIRRPYVGPAWLPVLLGTVIGALVFAKLQAAPLAVLLFVTSAALLARAVPIDRRKAMYFRFGAGVLAVPSITLLVVAAGGAFADFVTTYIIFPRYYVAGNCCTFAGVDFFLSDPSFAAFFIIAVCAAAVILAGLTIARYRGYKPIWKAILPPFLFFVLMTLVAIGMVEAPQTPFTHYLLFLLLPVSGIFATLINALTSATATTGIWRSIRIVALVTIVVVSSVPAARGALNDNYFLDHYLLHIEVPRDELTEQLRREIRPGQRVAMWGWSPQYLVYTDAVMGTRDSIAQFQIEPRSFQAYYRARYLRDVTRNDPDFVMEAVGPKVFNYHNRATQGIASFPGLAALVAQRYTAILDVEDVRLFKRNDLMGTVKPRPH